ncbi:MAG: hypothetical protein FWB86_01920 [Treponema sp.]|nr:hypothetical protein [Treponema sp.]MCL2250917.1 hypothetical protein [Treponema sp.]
MIFILLISLPLSLFAQEGFDPDIEPDWEYQDDGLYDRGDQTFVISLGVTFPTFFINNAGKLNPNKFDPSVGGTGSLNYNYYFGPYFFLGGEISGLFIHTLGGNTLFIIPLGLKAGTQFVYKRFEFPISLTLGMCWHTYINMVHYGMYLKGGVAAYFRATQDWSFGLSSEWAWFPQWTNDKNQSVNGNFVHLMLTARYHF